MDSIKKISQIIYLQTTSLCLKVPRTAMASQISSQATEKNMNSALKTGSFTR